jgi:hypothetical protein
MVPVGIGRDNLKHLFAGRVLYRAPEKTLKLQWLQGFFIALKRLLPFIVPFIN